MVGTRGPRRFVCYCALVAAAGALLAPGASAGVGATDAASARKLVEERVSYDAAIAAEGPAMAAAGSAFSAQIALECNGVLALAEKRREGPAGAAKRFGEESREREQSEILEQELQAAIEHAVLAPVSSAFAAYRQTLLGLPWEDPTLATAVSVGLEHDLEALAPPPPVCADAGAWVASGYRRLSTSTRSFLAQVEARRKAPEPAGDATLERLESHAGRSLRARLDAAHERAESAVEKSILPAQGAWSAIGLPHSHNRETERPVVHSTRLAQGRTAAGKRYFASVQARPHARSCRYRVAVLDLGRREGGIERCTGHVARAGLTVPCFERERPILALLPADVRGVRLVLADGSTISSRTVAVPLRFGGPASFYYQGLPAARVPVTLAELDAHGATLAVAAVPRASRCVRHGVMFLPHGIQPLARLSVPDGQQATIKGEAFVYQGPAHFGIKISFSGGGAEGVGMNGAQPKVLLDAELNRCYPRSWELVYGVLKVGGARVLARTAAGETPLAQAPIPRHLHAGGVLVYGLFTEPLQSLVVQAADGHELLEEPLAQNSKFHQEYCEGFLEPGREPQQDSSLF